MEHGKSQLFGHAWYYCQCSLPLGQHNSLLFLHQIAFSKNAFSQIYHGFGISRCLLLDSQYFIKFPHNVNRWRIILSSPRLNEILLIYSFNLFLRMHCHSFIPTSCLPKSHEFKLFCHCSCFYRFIDVPWCPNPLVNNYFILYESSSHSIVFSFSKIYRSLLSC